MASLLLAIIYLSFISLGLPDSLLGSAWPVMRLELGASLSFAGVVSMIISGGTIMSSLLSDRVTRRLGTGRVTAASVAMTAAALFGFSTCRAAWMLCLWAIPYGLGAGGVDAALNNYVALHYSGRHMSWLHGFWGVGASISPYIMSACLTAGNNWRGGYRTVSLIQFVLTAALFLSLPLWKKQGENSEKKAETVPIGLRGALKIRGVPYVLTAFFCYCALESTAGLWASSYLVEHRGIDANTAAAFASLFYLGITFGRFISGFVSDRLGDRTLIRIGIAVMLCGMAGMMLPVSADAVSLCGLLVIGLGCAPVYPSIIHATPIIFGAENSQAVIGIQMACAYLGCTVAPPIFGFIAAHCTVALYPFWLAAFTALMLLMTELLNHRVKAGEQKS